MNQNKIVSKANIHNVDELSKMYKNLTTGGSNNYVLVKQQYNLYVAFNPKIIAMDDFVDLVKNEGVYYNKQGFDETLNTAIMMLHQIITDSNLVADR